MTKKIEELRRKIEEINAQMEDIVNAADNESRDFSPDEESRYNDLESRFSGLVKQLRREEKAFERKAELAGIEATKREADGATENENRARVEIVSNRAEDEPWDSFGQFCQAVRSASVPNGTIDPRLASESRAAGDGNTSSIGSDGGFLIKTEQSNEMLKRVYNNSEMVKRCTRRTITSGANSIEINGIDETSRADGSRFGGVRAYWEAEAAQMTESKPKFRKLNFKPKKLTGLYFATDEVLEDATILGAEVEESFVGEFDFKIQDAVTRGDGAGTPLGILNSGAIVSVSAEDGQEAATIMYENIAKMWSRMWAASRANAVWYINQDVEPQLFTMGLTVGTGGSPVYLPPGGASSAPYGTLFGRPVVPIEQCSTIGTTGDIMLADMSQYYLVDKGGIQAASSVHLKFDYNQTAFRWIVRVDGQPKWSSVLTPYKGTNTLSPFIVLASRS